MTLRSLRHHLVLAALLACPSLACSAAPDDATPVTEDGNEIVNVAQTDVERQSIGNCWLYAHASWAESMHKAATGQDFDVSQSYWTYWHWFDQIAGGYTSTISTGGGWAVANNIVKKYGLMNEKDFVATDTTSEMSARQKSALDALNLSLTSGALADPATRRDKKRLRAEMDRAWGLTPETSALIDDVFGASVTRTFSSRTAARAGTAILRAQDFEASYSTAPGVASVKKSLLAAQSEWRQVSYSGGDRAFLQRVQRALHTAQPVIISWFVDFNAMENREGPLRGSFNMKTLSDFGPGRQGGHMTVLEDYEAKLQSGQVLKAGETLEPSDPRLAEALTSGTSISFFRVKNSWGAARVDRAFAPGMPGYHDLYMDYLEGPVKKCAERNGETDTTNCPSEQVPLKYVILPPGY